MAAQRGLGEAGFVDTTPYQRSEGRIGVSVRPCSNYFEISTVTPGGASHKAGVRAGDVLLSVNETPVINWPLDMVAAMLKGETGTWVRLTLQRPAPLGGKTQFDVMVERESSLPSRPHAVENMRRIPADRGQLPAAAAPRGVGAPTVVGSMKSSADFMDPLLAPLQQINLVDGFHNGVKAITHPLHSAGTHVHASLVAFKEPTSPAQPPAACSPLPPPARIDSMNLPAQGGLVGLVNLGNTCFLNSIVQCLVHAIPLASCVVFQLEDAQQHPHDKLPPSTTAASAVSAADGGSGGSGAGDQQGAEKRAVDSELVRAFKHLCSNMWSGQHRQAIHAKTLFEALRSDRRCAALFNHRQQDAHECLCVLLDALHQDTNGVLQTGGSEECAGAGNGANSRDSGRGVGSGMRQGSLAEAGWVEVEEDMVVVGADGSPESSCVACDMADKSRGTPSPQGSEVLEVHSVVSKFVAGRLCSEVSCASCGFSTQNHEQFFTLSLPVPQRRTPQASLADCFQLLETEESSIAWCCEKCRKTEASKKIWVSMHPKILIVHLERFGYTPSTGRRFKRDDPVTVPASFVRFDKNAKGSPGDQIIYDLYAWTDHHGSDDSCGHYTAHSRHLDGLFYKFDDARVTKADKPAGSFTSRSAYVLFFERR